MKVAVTYNLKPEEGFIDGGDEPPDAYCECDDPATIEAVAAALAAEHEVVLVEANEECFARLRDCHPDFVFNMAEGLYGLSRESHLPAILEMLRIPYTGSAPLALAVSLDKGMCKAVLKDAGLPIPAGFLIENESQLPITAEYPMIVKPTMEGSSKGITNDSLVYTDEQLTQQVQRVLGMYHQPVLVEEFLPGREFTVALLGNGADVQVLPIVEILLGNLPKAANPIYSFEAKWVWDSAASPLEMFECPANISEALRMRIEEICKRAFHTLGCRDWCRIDVRLDAQGDPRILEVNPLPGILPNPEQNSCFPKAARAFGLSYDQLIRTVLRAALKRTGMSM
ncbi:MAG: ATP-grasp domain-containing protein [Limnochordia bacterium]|nr:ATP-grasp domain-containing protein [Limnochordia bacterium]